MKYLLILSLFYGCGTKNKVDVSGKVVTTAPTQFNVTHDDMEITHKIVIDETAFEESCIKKYEKIDNDIERNKKIDKCVEDKQNTVAALIQTLNKDAP
jgi:hypothetical protein